jgi:hypothetical protein
MWYTRNVHIGNTRKGASSQIQNACLRRERTNTEQGQRRFLAHRLCVWRKDSEQTFSTEHWHCINKTNLKKSHKTAKKSQIQATTSNETSVSIYQTTPRQIPGNFSLTGGCWQQWKFIFMAGHFEVRQRQVSFMLWDKHTPEKMLRWAFSA